MPFRDKVTAPDPDADVIVKRGAERFKRKRLQRIRESIKRARKVDLPGRIDNQRELAQALMDVAAAAVKDEITNDPMGLGYAGKSDQEIADLLNGPWILQVPAVPGPGTVDVPQPARIFQIWLGLPYCPNAVDAADVAELKV